MSRENAWWAIARSEEVTDKKPLAVDIGDQPVVLWRDKAGVARALEDRCPHRRAPLSLGCIRDSGFIQCGYHGWTYNGETGRLTEIPNMKDQQKFPPVYKARAFAVSEQAGFVRVSLDSSATAPAVDQEAFPYCGTELVSLDHGEYLDAMYDDPSLVIAIRGVSFSPYLMSELRAENGKLVMERSCLWAPVIWPAPFTAEFPITLLTVTDPQTGETQLTLRDEALKDLLHAVVSPVPAARGVTAVRWRAKQGARGGGLRGAILRGSNPFSVLPFVDGIKLRNAKRSVSMHGEQLRAAMLGDSETTATDAVAA